MPGSLEGKVALVTGAGSGIGRATALAFSREGSKVVVADVAVGGGEETVRFIRGASGEAIFVKTDVSKGTEVEELVARSIETYGRLDCAHNNAGIEGVIASTHEYTEDAWDQVMGINLKGTWLCMRYEIAQMLGQGGGAIVNTSSTAGLVGIPGQPAYVAAKHGVAGLTKVAALEYAKAGIRVNAVCPGPIRTPMVERFFAQHPTVDEQQFLAQTPVGRMGRPEEIAEAVVWLCSEAASYVTGHMMTVDGGFLAQ